MMDLTTALLRIRYRIGEPTPSYWTDLELISYVNDAKDDLQNAIETINKDYFERTSTLALKTNIQTYLLPADFMRLKRIRLTDSGLEATAFVPLDRSAQAFLDGMQQSAYNNAPYQYMYDIWQNIDDPETNSMKGMNISLSPYIPGDCTAEIVYSAALPDLADGADTFSFLDPFTGYILDQATYYALSKGPSGDYQNYGSRAEMKLNRILAVAARVNQQGSEFVRGFMEDTY